jgi:VWFA-related protein
VTVSPRLLFAAVAVSALAAASAATQAPSPAPAGVFPAGVEQVTVDVLVFDNKGAPVEGLRREDFTVREAGRPQAITSFEAVNVVESAPEAPPATRVSANTNPVPASRSFVILFDEMNLTPFTVGAARKAVQQFLEVGLSPGDVVTIVPTGGGGWWTERMPEGRAGLLAFLGHLEARFRPDTSVLRISDYEALQIHDGRNPQVLAEVLRRYLENGLPDPASASAEAAAAAAALDVSPGAGIVRSHADATYQAYVQRVALTLGVFQRVAEALRQSKGRKTVLFLSEGFALDPSQPGFREVVRAARDANAAFYFVDARGLLGGAGPEGAPGAGADQGRLGLEQDTLSTFTAARQESAGAESVAADTGGFSIRNTNDLAGRMRAVSRESRAYYLLGYVPADARRDGKFRKIEVEIARPGLTVRARRGYYAPSDKEPTPRRGEIDPVVRAAVDAPGDAAGIPLRLTAHGLGPVGAGKSAAVVVAEVDVRALDLRHRDKIWRGVLDTYTVVSSRQTGATLPQEKELELALPDAAYDEARDGGLPLFREFQLAPGDYQVRFLLRDRQSGRVGAVRHEFTVPDPAVLGTSTPILTDRLQPAGGQGGPRPIPVAHRNFKTGERLYYAFEVYGAGRDAAGALHLSSSFVVRSPDGSVLTRMEPRPMQASAQGQVSQMLAVSLAGAQEGSYELKLTVHDDVAGRSVEVSEPFTVGG